jgi:hypothetical protein
MVGRNTLAAVATAVLLVGGAATARAEPPAPPAPIVPPPVQPANIGDLKTEATAYYDSGAYLTDLQLATAPAVAWIDEEAPRTDRPAVVFDIDETALSNWEAIRANEFGRVPDGSCTELPHGPCGWRAWDLSARSTVMGPTMDVFNTARGHGAAVGYTGYTRLIMEPVGAHFASAADFKAPQRAAIEGQGYTIIANLGDQPSDLDGGFAERTYQLPNPFYRIP